MIKKTILLFSLILLVLMGAGWALLRMYVSGPVCGEERLQYAVSPDNKYLAETYLMSCGATTGYVTHVFVHKKDDRLSLDVDGLLPKLNEVCWTNGRKEISLRWVSNSNLQVGFREKGVMLNCLSKIDGIEISEDTN